MSTPTNNNQSFGIQEDVSSIYQSYIQSLNIRINHEIEKSEQNQHAADSLRSEITGLNKEITELKVQIERLKDFWGALQTPYGAGVSIVLILVLAYVSIKKGLTISKGDTKLTIGEGK